VTVAPATPVGAVACPPPPAVARDTTLQEVARMLQRRRVPLVLVGEGDPLVVTADDVVRALAGGAAPTTQIGEIAEARPVTVPAEVSVVAVVQLLAARQVTHVVLVDAAGDAVGSVGLQDLAGFVSGLVDRLMWAIGSARTPA
jgi:CBS domain-containing protein